MPSFYQDRLGTNIGKALKKSGVFSQALAQEEWELSRRGARAVNAQVVDQHRYNEQAPPIKLTRTTDKTNERCQRVVAQVAAVVGLMVRAVAQRGEELAVRKRHCLRRLYLKTIILPRQARDKHREGTQKRTRFCRLRNAARPQR